MQRNVFTLTQQNDEMIFLGETIDPDVVFECGQCFRFIKDNKGYVGVAHGHVLRVRQIGNGISIISTGKDPELWRNYFDLGLCYSEIEKKFAEDAVLSKTISCAKGMRLLNQDPFETIITFIISANNNIGRIRKIVENICKYCAKALEFEGKEYYAFPAPEELAEVSEETLRELGAGYRAEYIRDTAKRIADGYDLKRFYTMEYAEAKAELTKLKGIGPKVADCILLFAYNKKNAFPLDVWMKRVLEELYGFVPKSYAEAERFAEERFGGYAGIAQQYLFHYMRSSK